MFNELPVKDKDTLLYPFAWDYEGKRTYTVDEIQDILEISRTTAYNLVKQNLFRSVRIGGHIRISRRSFDNWLDANGAD